MGFWDNNDYFVCAIDFDGTIKKATKYTLESSDEWEINGDVEKFLRTAYYKLNVRFVLWTGRPEREINTIVKEFIEKHHLLDYFITLTPEPGEMYCHNGEYYQIVDFGGKNKILTDFYIDDLAVGFPLKEDGTPDWLKILLLMKEKIDGRNR